jgi:hypothetical protein
MTSKHCFMLLTAWVLIATACARSPAPTSRTSEPLEEHFTLDYRACTVDTDCVLALNGCCDCANGGQDIAVARDKAAEFKARFHCAGPCTEIGGNCGHGTIACENKLCVYREPTQP